MDSPEPEHLAAALARLASSQEDMASQLPRVLRKLDCISKAVDVVVDIVGPAEGRAESQPERAFSPGRQPESPPASPRPSRRSGLGSGGAIASAPLQSFARGLPRLSREVSGRWPGPERLSRISTTELDTPGVRSQDGARSPKVALGRSSLDGRRSGLRRTVPGQMPDSWPWSLEPCGLWYTSSAPSADEGRFLRRSPTAVTPTSLRELDHKSSKDNPHEGNARARAERSWHRFVIDPTTRVHMIYNLFCLGIIAYDLSVYPYYVAWGVELSPRALAFAMATAVWWLIDFGLNFTTATYLNGRLVWNRAAIREHYMRTWFLPDLAVVLVDTACLVVILLAASGSTTVNPTPFYAVRLARMVKILRVASALRMMKKAKAVKTHLQRRSLSESWQLCTKVASSFAIVLLVTHWAACGWYIVGTLLPTDTGHRWTEAIDDHKVGYQYATAFHVAVADLTLGGTEVECASSAERLYSCLLLFLGLLFGSSLVSGLSAAMVQGQMDQKERRVKIRTLQQFMRYHKVQPAMAIRVKQQAFERMRASRRVQYESVTVLRDLSASLVSELRFHICQPHISTHGLFRMMISLNQDMSERICAQAIGFHGLMGQDDLFVAGSEACSAYTVVDGTLTYTPSPWVVKENADIVKVGGGAWLAEAALWSKWIHVGRVTATTECTVLGLPVDKMTALIQRDAVLQKIMSGYCEEFHSILTNKEMSETLPTDLFVSRASFDEVVTSLDDAVQRIVYQAAIDQAAEQAGNSLWQHKAKLPRLQEEVDNSSAGVLLNAEGLPYRVLRTSVGRIELDDGRVLLELGRVKRLAPVNSSGGLVAKFKSGSPSKTTACITSNCQLPSLASEFSESPWTTWQRMLAGLEGMADRIEVNSQGFDQEWADSPELGVRTLHQRTTFHASVADEDVRFGDIDAARPRHSQGSAPRVSEDTACSAADHAMAPRAVTTQSVQSNGAPRRRSCHWDSVLADPICEQEFQATVVVVCEAPGEEVFYRWTPSADLEELMDRQDHQSRRALDKLLSRFDMRRSSLKLAGQSAGTHPTTSRPTATSHRGLGPTSHSIPETGSEAQRQRAMSC